MKNKGAGFYLTIITVVAAVAALVCYVWNCRTDYFASYGISKVVIGCMVVGILTEILVLGTGKGEPKIWKDILPVLGASCIIQI